MLSVNSRGIRDKAKREALFTYHRNITDILIVQETHSDQKVENIWTNEWGGKALFSHGTNNARGVAMFVSSKLFHAISSIEKDEDGRYILVDITEGEKVITLLALYAPNNDCPAFFETLRLKLASRHEHKIIIGDFNLTLEVEFDRKNTYSNNNKALEVVRDMMNEFYLSDVWRIQNGDKREYSWMKKGNINKASRIDFILVSAGLDQSIKNPMYVSSIKTDHRAIYCVVELNNQERGVGYWKFNTLLLQDQRFLDFMNRELDKTIDSLNEKAPKDKWEKIKERIKKVSSDFSRKKSSENSLVIEQLSEKVNEMEENFLGDQCVPNELLLSTKQELEEKLLERVRGLIFRSKVRWHEGGEKNTKYFFSLEKARYNAKTSFKIITDNGEELTDSKKILDCQREFYQNLYQADQGVLFEMQNKFNVFVPNSIREQQNIHFSVEHVGKAMIMMKNDRTPGEDGIPVDFYKVFWSKLKTPFMDMVMDCYQSKILHYTARQGILNLIPKANKDTRYVKNLRPITLLNTDYKIIEKTIANMMLPALEHIIHRDQRGFMKDRRISVNIRKLLDIMHYTASEDLEAVVMSLDFVKCFDKCAFSILHGSLDFFGFGQVVKDWTHILYHDFSVRVQNNGNFSAPINVRKGVHQGGCCSSVYFLVIAEILALSLRHNEDIKGITIKDILNILNQFADDMDVFSIASERSIIAIFKELEEFHKHSGFVVSYDKTTLYRIGSLRYSNAEMYSLSQYVWSKEDITVLGVTIAHDNIVYKNYECLIAKVRNTLKAWYNRGLSLVGKIQVVNTLVASLFVYKMTVLPNIPQDIVKRIDNIIREFIWNGKKAKISYKILQNSKKDGVMGLVNLQYRDIALKTTWPQILSHEPEYAQIVYHILRCPKLGEDIWRCSLMEEDVSCMNIREPFWKDVLTAWCKSNYYCNRRIENQILWYNSRVRVSGKPFFWADIFSKGLKYVYQLFIDQNFISYDQAQRFGLSKMRYNSLKASIPKDWKDFFSTTSASQYMPVPPHNYDLSGLKSGRSWSSYVYQHISSDVLLLHNKYIKWLAEVGMDFCEGLFDFASKHVNIYKITNIPKLRSFQYRLLQRGLVTNILLSKWNMRNSDNCSFCDLEQETVIHLFFSCVRVRELWIEIVEYVENRFNEKVNFNLTNTILDQWNPARGSIANLVCLASKQYIYAQKCLGQQLNFVDWKVKINAYENLEKYVAVKNGHLFKHNKKWKVLSSSQNRTELDEYIGEYIQNI